MTKMSDIGSIINHAKDIFKQLKENHPGPKCYLVFSSPFGQGGLKSGIELFSEFPEMFLPEDLVKKISDKMKEKKKTAKELTKKNDEVEKRMRDLKGKLAPGDAKDLAELKDKIRIIDDEIKDLLKGLIIKDDVFVEIRFEQLNFEFIQKLKEDPLVSQKYTTQEARSIRVVLFRVNEVED
jgi:hypothetical protein